MLFDDITGVLGGAQSWVEQQWTQRIVQISVYAAILFFVLSSFDLINKVDGFIVKSLNVKLGKEGTRALHAATLGFFMYVGVKFILDPFVHKFVNGKTVEGTDPDEDSPSDNNLDGDDPSRFDLKGDPPSDDQVKIAMASNNWNECSNDDGSATIKRYLTGWRTDSDESWDEYVEASKKMFVDVCNGTDQN